MVGLCSCDGIVLISSLASIMIYNFLSFLIDLHFHQPVFQCKTDARTADTSTLSCRAEIGLYHSEKVETHSDSAV